MKVRNLLSAAMVVAAAGCFIATKDGTGAGCAVNDDCGATGYVCVSSAVWPQKACAENEEGCLCEIKFPPDIGASDGGGSFDGGPDFDGGTWCADIKFLFNRSCIGTCHNDNPVYPNAPKGFRLDSYRDIGPNLGVQSKIDRVKARNVDTRDMPPVTELLAFPFSPEERNLVFNWYRAGYPEGDGPCDNTFTNPDAGNDGGRADAGVDAGLVSFANVVVPIFQTRCGPCHTTNTAGQLSLLPANAYAQLVGPNAVCNAAVERVMPGNLQGSMLWRKLMNTNDKCGNAMPNLTAGLAVTQPAEFQRIQTWIQQGAQNN
jgi:hypothetical protein